MQTQINRENDRVWQNYCSYTTTRLDHMVFF